MTHETNPGTEAVVEAMYAAAAARVHTNVEVTGEVMLGNRGAYVLIRERNLDGLSSCRWIWISDDLCVAAFAD